MSQAMSAERVSHRWMLRRDMKEVLAIEWLCFEREAWSEEDFANALKQKNIIGVVFEDDREQIIGYVVYALWKREVQIINLAVHPSQQRRGVGTQIVDYLKTKLTSHGRQRLAVMVEETKLGALKFFGRCGFEAIGLAREPYDHCDRDGIHMVYKYRR